MDFSITENYFEGLKFDSPPPNHNKNNHFSQILHYEFRGFLLLSLSFFCNYSLFPNTRLLVELLIEYRKCLRNLIQM